jgi:hypothetical protein
LISVILRDSGVANGGWPAALAQTCGGKPWVWLYRMSPQVLNAMVLVKPSTVVLWHRKGFRLFWRWRSRRPGTPQG